MHGKSALISIGFVTMIAWSLSEGSIAAPQKGQAGEESEALLGRAAAEPVAIDARPLAVESRIEAVTAYLGRAAVTRVVQLDLAPGVYDLRFAGLPESIQPNTLQARSGGPAKVLGVEFESRQVATAASPKLAELDAKIEQVRRALEGVAEQHKINAAQGALIDQIGVRIADDASKAGGTDKLNINSLREQIAFMAEERGKLATRREELDKKKRELDEQMRLLQAERTALGAGGSKTDRVAVVTAAVSSPSQVTVELTYLVANATWEPRYNIRAAADGSSATIEYNALLAQRTGEDWDNVRLTLSTAQPTQAANPPSLQPWFVELVQPVKLGIEGFDGDDMGGRKLDASPARPGTAGQFRAKMADASELERLSSAGEDASVGGTGPSVTFALPRLVTVKSNADKQQTTRIAMIDTQPQFVYVAVPSLTKSVYIRGTLSNASDYQLLPGAAAVFMGQDYVGPTALPAVAPKGEFKVHFGSDQSVTAGRQLVARKESRTGLFNGGLRTSFDYRLQLENGAGKPITIELWDRIPVSRTDRVKIEMADPSKPLASDAEFVEQQKPQGMLKWLLNVPATATGKNAEVVTYSVRVDRAADVHHTPIPD